MGRPAARISDMHTCPLVNGVVPHVGGPIAKGCPTVIVGGLPQARVSDNLVCVGPPDVIVQGSTSVFVGNMPAARMGDQTAHAGVIVVGCPTVLIGDYTSAGGGGGGGTQADALTTGPAFAAAQLQADTLREAAKSGVPFVERCQNSA